MSIAIATRLIYIFFPAVSEHFVKLYQLCWIERMWNEFDS